MKMTMKVQKIINLLADDPDPLVRGWAAGFGPSPWVDRLLAAGSVVVGGRWLVLKTGPTRWRSGGR